MRLTSFPFSFPSGFKRRSVDRHRRSGPLPVNDSDNTGAAPAGSDAGDDPEQNSVTIWIKGLKAGDADAIRQIWNRYCDALVGVARNRLGESPRAVSDEEDVALSAFYSLCRRAADGQFGDLNNRNDLWWLLLAITRRKAIDQVRHGQADCRGGEAVTVSISAAESERPGEPPLFRFDELISNEPTPEYLAVLSEEYERLLRLLRDDSQRRVAILRIEGHTPREIAAALTISLRSVERKLDIVRKTWARDAGLVLP